MDVCRDEGWVERATRERVVPILYAILRRPRLHDLIPRRRLGDQHRVFYATVQAALSTGQTVNACVYTCTSAWGLTMPTIVNLGTPFQLDFFGRLAGAAVVL